MRQWICQYDSNLFNHLSFRQKNNFGIWSQDDDIIILYCEYVSKILSDKINTYNEKFDYKWNFKVLNPIINDFVNYANKYISEESASGIIEFVHTGEKVCILYL